MSFGPGEIISYTEMCLEEGVSLQRGMNFRIHDGHSVVLMSRRANAPYADQVVENGQVIVYEGHDARRSPTMTNPKAVKRIIKKSVLGLAR